MSNHAPDCALVLHSHIDPALLTRPLICDCDMDAGGDGDGDQPLPPPVTRVRSQAASQANARVTLEGSAAAAVQRLKVAKVEYDAALKAMIEELTR